MIKTKNRGNIFAPTFQVYAIGAMINDNRTWCQLRSYLATRDYIIGFEDPGINVMPMIECSICHGADHPRGLCPFLSPGWNGLTHKEDPPLIDPGTGRKIGGHELPANRDRYRGRAGWN
jgi:hypothetical protein